MGDIPQPFVQIVWTSSCERGKIAESGVWFPYFAPGVLVLSKVVIYIILVGLLLGAFGWGCSSGDDQQKPGSFGRIDGQRHEGDFSVSGRLVGPDEKALANETLTLRVVASRSPWKSETQSLVVIRTDEQGSFKHTENLHLPADDAIKRYRFIFEREETALRGPASARLGFAPRDLTATMDLGEVRLHESTFLASGIVTNQDGDLIPQALIVSDFGSINENQSEGTSPEIFGRFHSNDGGKFRAIGERRGDAIKLIAMAEGYLRQEAVVHVGDATVSFALQPAGAAKGRLILPNGFTPHDVIASVESDDGSESCALIVDAQGLFEIKWLEGGTYTFRAYLRDWRNRPLREISGVEIQPGKVKEIGDVEIPYIATRLELVVEEPSMMDPQEILVTMNRPGTRERQAGFYLRKPDRFYLMPVETFDMHLAASGFRTTTIHDVKEGVVRIKMKTGIPVRINHNLDRMVPKDIELSCFPVAKKVDLFATQRRVENGVHLLAAPGTYRILVSVKRKGNMYSRVAVETNIPDIEVLDRDEEQVFAIHLDAEAVLAAIAKLK